MKHEQIMQLAVNELVKAENNVVTEVLKQILKFEPNFKDYNDIELIEFSKIPYTKRVLYKGRYIGKIEYDFENRNVTFNPMDL